MSIRRVQESPFYWQPITLIYVTTAMETHYFCDLRRSKETTIGF